MINERNPRIDASRFSMIPKADVPRSTFLTRHEHKTTFKSGWLVPIHVDEVLPGDVHAGNMTLFARLSTPLFPIMDNITLETFFFFVPSRLVWDNWRKFMGEQTNPGDSISYLIPQTVSPAGGFPIQSIFDFFGLPTATQLGANTVSVNTLPARAYALIWNEWFRDENLQSSITISKGDGPDLYTAFPLKSRNKRHDYFTSALPWPTKNNVLPSIPLAGSANVKGIAVPNATAPNSIATLGIGAWFTTGLSTVTADSWVAAWEVGNQAGGSYNMALQASQTTSPAQPIITADLSTATGMTINAMRLAFATQKLLERDARGGTRYTELLRAHFGVTPEDSRLQRPEYIGGGRTDMNTAAIAQTSATGLTGGTSPIGSLGAAATAADRHNFVYHATEHGYIIGLIHAGANLSYQQGINRMWTRQSRYDFYWPEFAHLGEQIIRNDEIYAQGTAADSQAFGYQERWAEYRHRQSKITGMFKSTTAGAIDGWHLSLKFNALPTLGDVFITDAPPLSRALAAGVSADTMQVLADMLFEIKCTRPMPTYSVPGMLDRF